MPRIAFISSTFPDYQKCGTGIYAGYLTSALAQQGHDIHVVTTAIPEIRPTFGKVTIHKIMETWNPSDLPKLIKLFRELRPDLIHINHPTALAGERQRFLVNLLPEINSALWHLPVVTTIHEFPNVSRLGKIKLVPLLLGSDLVTVTNRHYKEAIVKFMGQSRRNKIEVVNIGSQFDERRPPATKIEQRERWDLKPDDRVLGFLGFITPPKGFHNLIEAVAPLLRTDPKLKVLAVSSWNLSTAAYRQKILERIKKEEIANQVIFTGFLEDAEMSDALSAIDVCVFPFEHAVEERSSGPLRQALVRGLPTIVYANNINYDEFGFRHGENIWFTEINDIEQLREDIINLINDSQLREKLSEGTRRLRDEFSFDTVSNAMSRLYSRLLASKSLQSLAKS